MPDEAPPTHLVAGLHSRGVLPHLKREGGTYFVTFRQAGTLPREVLLRFKQEREAILQQAQAAKRPLTWHEQTNNRCPKAGRITPKPRPSNSRNSRH